MSHKEDIGACKLVVAPGLATADKNNGSRWWHEINAAGDQEQDNHCHQVAGRNERQGGKIPENTRYQESQGSNKAGILCVCHLRKIFLPNFLVCSSKWQGWKIWLKEAHCLNMSI